MVKKDSCEENAFEKCLNVCKAHREKIRDCIPLCGVGIKNVCGRKTRVKIANVSVETEDSKKGWVLVIIFCMFILVTVFIFLIKQDYLL